MGLSTHPARREARPVRLPELVHQRASAPAIAPRPANSQANSTMKVSARVRHISSSRLRRVPATSVDTTYLFAFIGEILHCKSGSSDGARSHDVWGHHSRIKAKQGMHVCGMSFHGAPGEPPQALTARSPPSHHLIMASTTQPRTALAATVAFFAGATYILWQRSRAMKVSCQKQENTPPLEPALRTPHIHRQRQWCQQRHDG